jgi:glycosyltransferase involved in cell wall biosynthesis
MTKKNLQGKRIIATVTNPLFHDKRMERICSALVEAGAEVTLVGVKRSGVPEPAQRSFEQVRIRTGFQSGFMFYACYNFLVFFYLLFKRFDLLISVDLDTLPVGYLLSGIKGKKRIYDAHEFFTEVPEVERRPFVKAVWEFIARICIGQYNMTVSGSLGKVLEEKYGKPFAVIRNLPDHDVDLNRKPKSIDPDGPVNLLYVGYLNEGRGLEYIIEALYLLPDRFQLFLAGGGDIEKELKELLAEKHLDDRVTFTGWIAPDDIPSYLEKAHLGFNLLESRSSSYYYSLANKTFDYIHFGLPAIHMEFPEYESLKHEYDCLITIPRLDPNYLSKMIRALAEDKDRYGVLSNNCPLASKELHWSKEKELLLDKIGSMF